MYKVVTSWKIQLIFVILIGIFLRFANLDRYPVQLNHDEISQLYDLKSVTETGRDIYGNYLPLAFPSTGDFKPAHYIYISLIPYYLFGDREFTIRVASAFFGSLTVLATFLLIRRLTSKTGMGLLSSLMVAIGPAEVFYSRKSFENVIGISLIILGCFLVIKDISAKTRIYVYLAMVSLIGAMYIYTAHFVVVPLFLLTFFVINRRLYLANLRKYLLPLYFSIILIIPLTIILLTNQDIKFRANSVFITQDIFLNQQLNIIDDSDLSGWIFKQKVFTDYAFGRLLKQFNITHIFTNGLNMTNQNLLNLGPLMLVSLPFVVFGYIYIFKEERWKNVGIILVILPILFMIPSAITFEEYSTHRTIMSYSVLVMVSGIGLYGFLTNIKRKYCFILAILLVVFLFGLNFFYAFNIYTINYPYEKSQYLHYPYKDVAKYVWSEYDNYDQIIVDPVYGQSAPTQAVAVHYYLLYYGQVPTTKFQGKILIDNNQISFDKFVIRKVNWPADFQMKNTLIIASPWDLPSDKMDRSKLLNIFKFYDGQIAFYAVRT